MGIIKRGILGGFSNKVANVVGTSWKGRAVIKSLPLSVANPRTTPQVNQRSKFKGASQLASLLLGLWIKPLWDRFAGNIAGVNAWMKDNTELFDNSGVPTYGALVMSKGKMQPPTVSALVGSAGASTVSVSGDLPADVTWGQNGETLFVVGINQNTGEVAGNTNTGNPEDTVAVVLAFNELTVGDVVSVYLAIKRADGTQVSNSQYADVVVGV